MPRYEYRCRSCGDTFELTRTMSEANAPTRCPAGHDDTVKLLSTVALTGRGGGAGLPTPGPAPPPAAAAAGAPAAAARAGGR